MKIALLGCGVVGGGILDICNKRSDTELEYVLVRRPRPELGDKAVSDIETILMMHRSIPLSRSWAACILRMNM